MSRGVMAPLQPSQTPRARQAARATAYSAGATTAANARTHQPGSATAYAIAPRPAPVATQYHHGYPLHVTRARLRCAVSKASAASCGLTRP